MQIKQEINCSQNLKYTFASLQNRLLQDIKEARQGNNAQNNCMHLTNYMLNLFEHYFHGGEKPLKPTTESSASISASLLSTDFIEIEGKQKKITANFAVNHGDNPLPPVITTFIDSNTNTEREVLDLYAHPRRTMVNSFDELHNRLLNTVIDDPSKYVYGQIALSNKRTHAPGHMFVYLAGEGNVLYIDPQFYNGITLSGLPIFNSQDLKKNYTEFKNEVYFLEHGAYRKIINVGETQRSASYLSNSSATASSKTTFTIYSDITIEAIKTIPRTIKSVRLDAGVTPAMMAALPAFIEVVLINGRTSIEAIKATPNTIKQVYLGAGFTPAMMMALPAFIEVVVINGRISIEAIKALPNTGKKVCLGLGVTQAMTMALPIFIQAIFIYKQTPIEAIKALPNRIKKVHLYDVTSAMMAALPAFIHMVAINWSTPIEAIKALPNTVKHVHLDAGVMPAMMTALPAFIQMVAINENTPTEAIKALPNTVKQVHLGAGVTPAMIAALPVFIQMVAINGSTPIEAIKALPNTVKQVYLGAGVTPAMMAALPGFIQVVVISGSTLIEAIKTLPNTVKQVCVDAGVTPAMIAALPAFTEVVVINGSTLIEAIKKLPNTVKQVSVDAGVTPAMIAALPAFIEVVGISKQTPIEVIRTLPNTVKTVHVGSGGTSAMVANLPAHVHELVLSPRAGNSVNHEQIILLSIHTTLTELASATKVLITSNSTPVLVAALPPTITEVIILGASENAINALPITVKKIKLDENVPVKYLPLLMERMDEIKVMGKPPFFIKKKLNSVLPVLASPINTVGLKRNSFYSTHSDSSSTEDASPKIARIDNT